MSIQLPDLPIRPLLPQVSQTLGQAGAAVLIAPPGAGKTTTVPLALLEAEWMKGQKVLVLEPRRLAARAAAHRMTALAGEEAVGGLVGYRIRMDTRVSRYTRIEVVTEGVLTRMLQSDPSLSGVGAILFDEFHERSLHADLGLALALQSRRLFRDDLRVLVMSATLDPGPVANLLSEGGEPAPVLESQGREYPVETRWRKTPVEGWIEPPVVATVLASLEETEGDVLVFLPGAGEIRRTHERLRDAGVPSGVSVHPLHGGLSQGAQDRALRRAPPGERKVVLASAIAETSLTIEGIRVVVDAGLMRVPRFDPGTGMTRLETVRVTRDSADQRRGRAGRVAPGVCYRLWTRGEDRGLVPRRRPEILEADLAPLLLELKRWGAEPLELDWIDPPPEASLAQAGELLEALGILDHQGELTERGQEVGAMGVHPRLGRMLVGGRAMGAGGVAAELAALLGERDILQREGRAPDADLRLRVEALRRGRVALGGHRVHRGGLARVRREVSHWKGVVGGADGGGQPSRELGPIGVLAALAYPDRIGQRREGERGRFLLRSGRGAAFAESQSLEDQDWLVAVEVAGQGREARIFQAAPLTLEEIQETFGDQIREEEEISWDDEAGRVRARRVARLGALEVARAPLVQPDPHRVAQVLTEGIAGRGLHVLPWDRESTQLRERLHFLHGVDPEEWPSASEAELVRSMDRWLLPFLGGMRSLDDLRGLKLAQALLSPLSWEEQQELDRLAPTHLEVPSGSRIRLDYSDPEAPALAVRLQEVFGMEETPRIAGGQVPVTMRLLSPAQRPVQVTRDLSSFWDDAYFQVRKDMRGRYPKHYWPEDPRSATPTRRTRPR